jgi:mono/diheme cytochrome c family protein
MKSLLPASVGLTLAAASLALAQTPAAPVAKVADPNRALLDKYCVTCHNAKLKTGGIAFDKLDLANAPADAATWEKALRKLRGNLMPPPGLPQPPHADVVAFMSWMETTLDTHPKGPTAGYVPVERLNRTEYAASVKSLLGVDVNEKDILPQDIQVEGFDNIASSLTTSPAFLDQYLDAARRIAKKAVGDMRPPISSWSYKPAGNTDPEIPMSPGLRGGMKIEQIFPADGEYRINLFDLSIGLYNSSMQNSATLVLLLDGKPFFKGALGGPADLRLANVKGTDGWQQILDRFQKIPVKIEAGKHTIAVAFIDRSHVESDENVGNGGGRGGGPGGGGGVPLPRLPNAEVDAMEIKGPYNPTGITNSPSRPLIFICDPTASRAGQTAPIGEAACAKQITENLAHRAFRRPITADDTTRLMNFYNEGRLDNGTFDQGITEVVAGVLASPDFLFRSLPAPRGITKNTEFPLTDLELASRLSFFIWNTGPDAELLKLAENHQLSKPGTVDAQVKRMMADPRAESLVTGFAMKWLNLNSLDLVQPDPKIFRGFDATMRKDFQKEAELFLGSVLLSNQSVVELLTSDKTFLNNRLARHYGVSGPSTSAFKEVTLTDPNRFGLLGKAAVLMRTSYGDRTSPVLRGAWVLDKIIGSPPSPPPPNVVTNLPQQSADAPKTVRARLEMHRDNASCKMCHGVIDPTGLALENFDAIGQYRKTDREANNAPIDASTVLPNGVAINGPVELRAQLAGQGDAFVGALTEKLMMYAINRQLEYFDMPQVRRVVSNAKKDDYTLTALVLGVVNSDAFRKQGPALITKSAPPAAPAPKQAAIRQAPVTLATRGASTPAPSSGTRAAVSRNEISR